MNKHDTFHTSAVENALDLATVTAASTNGEIIEVGPYMATRFAAHCHAYTDGSWTFKLQHGDESDGSDFVDVDDDETLGKAAIDAEPVTAVGVTQLGYIGKKKYVRLVLLGTTITSGAQWSAIVNKENAVHA